MSLSDIFIPLKYPELLRAYWRSEEFFLFKSPYRLLNRVPPEFKERELELTYGEIDLFTVEKILKNLELGRGATLLDLGCGRGKILLLSTALGFRAFGIELVPDLIDAARYSIQGLPEEWQRRVSVLSGDFLELEWPESIDVIWAVGTCWGDAVRASLAEKFSSLEREVIIVSVSRPFLHPKLKLLREVPGWTSWGRERFFIQTNSKR